MNRGYNLNFDTRITTGEREVSKIRADVFFRLQQGEFITFVDGKDRKIQFNLPKIKKELPKEIKQFTQAELSAHFDKVYSEARSIFNTN